MPSESLLAGTGWKDLPPAVHTHILSFLFEHPEERGPRPTRIPISGDFAPKITIPLPNDLLSVAASSPDLRDRVAEVLGPRAQYLTVGVTGNRLDTWVSTLDKDVRAVSALDRHLADDISRSRENGQLEDLLVIKRDSAFRLFRSLHEKVKLQVLDLKDVPLYDCNDTDGRLLNGLVGALEQSGESLKELALPVAELSSKALERVSFSNLQVVEFELSRWRRYERQEISDAEDERVSEACKQMLRSLNGHATGCQNRTTIRELRLLNVHTPWVDNAQSNFLKGLRNAVTTLRLECRRRRCPKSHPQDSDVMFISFFPNLESLHWNGVVLVPEHLEKISSACSNMQELHLRPATLHNEGDFESLEAVLLASQKKIRTLDASGRLYAKSMKRVGELCPGLRDVRLAIERETVGALASLLGLCPHIRTLALDVGEHQDDMLSMEWEALVDAFHSASDQLSEVHIIAADWHCDLELIVRSFIQVVAILGERARDVRLYGHMTESGLKRLADVSCDILRACSSHTKKLECLQLWLDIETILITESEKQEKELVQSFLRERRNLIEAAPQMHTAYLEPFDWWLGCPMRSDEIARRVFVRTRSE